MMTALLVCLAAAPTAADPTDFFPLQPGNKWVYREEARFSVNTVQDEVLEPVEIGGLKAFPVESTQEGKVIETVYYRVAGDTIYIVAYDPKTPLDPPRPLFKLGERRETWDYVGLTPFLKDLVPIKVRGESAPKGKRKVLGQEVECLEVKFDAQLGRTTDDRVDVKQTSIYGKGIGAVEMTGKTLIGRESLNSKLTLLEFKPAGL